MRHDRGTVVHLALHRAGYLDRLKLGLERAREGTLDHALEPVLEALQHSHQGHLLPLLASDSIGACATACESVLT